jgi:hypothetical protein
MTFEAIDAWWWPYLFILIAGALATDIWRFLGVYLAGGIAEDSDLLVLVRCVATALVAAVIANLIVFPSGALAETPAALRIGAALCRASPPISFSAAQRADEHRGGRGGAAGGIFLL